MPLFLGSVTPLFGCVAGLCWVLMLIHCVRNPQLQKSKVWWLLLMLFVQWSAIFYFLIYVVPRDFWKGIGQWLLASQSIRGSTYNYQPPTQMQPLQPVEPYQPYQQGYQAQAPHYGQYQPTPAPVYIEQEEQTLTTDYEQPQTMYPEMPPQPL